MLPEILRGESGLWIYLCGGSAESRKNTVRQVCVTEQAIQQHLHACASHVSLKRGLRENRWRRFPDYALRERLLALHICPATKVHYRCFSTSSKSGIASQPDENPLYVFGRIFGRQHHDRSLRTISPDDWDFPSRNRCEHGEHASRFAPLFGAPATTVSVESGTNWGTSHALSVSSISEARMRSRPSSSSFSEPCPYIAFPCANPLKNAVRTRSISSLADQLQCSQYSKSGIFIPAPPFRIGPIFDSPLTRNFGNGKMETPSAFAKSGFVAIRVAKNQPILSGPRGWNQNPFFQSELNSSLRETRYRIL